MPKKTMHLSKRRSIKSASGVAYKYLKGVTESISIAARKKRLEQWLNFWKIRQSEVRITDQGGLRCKACSANENGEAKAARHRAC